MYEKLTSYLEKINDVELSKQDCRGNKSDINTEYEIIKGLIKEIDNFAHSHLELNLISYADVLEEYGLKWASDSMENADVSKLDGKGVMALLVGTYRAGRFSEGIFNSFCKNGKIKQWLLRLKQIDDAA